MKKADMIEKIRDAGYPASTKQTHQELAFACNIAQRKMRDWLKAGIINEGCTPRGNWNTAKNWFPDIEIGQKTRDVCITTYDTYGYQEKASIDTEECKLDLSATGQALYVRGSVYCRNWRRPKCSGSQGFCFAIFVGDSGHVYIHRAPATKGWMQGDPNQIKKRLRKLGIGADEKVVQQGDFLLKPANSNGYPDAAFAHETMGAGHHRFEIPVLYATGSKGRQYLIQEPTLLLHHAIDNIQHPTITVPPGKYIVGTTASQLAHGNSRD